MEYSISKKEVAPQRALVQRKTASGGAEISKAIGDALGSVFAFVQKNGIEIAGRPFARYPEIGPDSMTVEPGIFIASDGGAAPEGDDDIQSIELPGGSVATTLHRGPYDTLHEAYAALEKWIEAEELTASAPPWEVYVTDPMEVEDPAAWETEIFWPVE